MTSHTLSELQLVIITKLRFLSFNYFPPSRRWETIQGLGTIEIVYRKFIPRSSTKDANQDE
jgi:hypothetical protein